MNDELQTITPQQASDMTGIPSNTIYDLLARGDLRGIKTGRHWRIKVTTLREWPTMPHDERLTTRN